MEKDTFRAAEWTYKELFLLLFLILVIVPIGIEYLLQGYLYDVFQNKLYAGTLTGFIMAIVFMLGLYLVALKPHHIGWDAVGIRRFSRKYWKLIIVSTIVLIAASILIVILMELVHIGAENSKTEALQQDITWFTFSIGFISAAIISPIYEEIFYRGFLYKWFRVKWGVGAGMLCSSFIFTIVHLPTYNTLPVNFASGIIFAWTYEKSGSVLPAMIVHGVFNGLAIILTALG
ncbi:type II CAAX endopeptidase family protein [Oceanobacillus sp. FSL K6-2867]|uniref:CPBP family intramembrane glutamic endopeptidase n=1 Tax=Oceanobacillus sp. FSL K6-2867 TaxID=2954748 RepID=UPI0030D7AB5C